MIIFLLAAKTSALHVENNELITLATIFEENQLEIDNWQVVVKEKMPLDKANSFINTFNDHDHVEKTNDENMTKYLIKHAHNDEKIFVSYNIIVPHNHDTAEMIVLIEGSNWDEKVMANYLVTFNDIYRQYFTENARIFACLSSREDAIMKSVYIFDEFTHKLNLQQISTQLDTTVSDLHKEIMYGYTSLWDTSKLTISDRPVNVQIVVQHTKNSGKDETKIAVGTPILINEY